MLDCVELSPRIHVHDPSILIHVYMYICHNTLLLCRCVCVCACVCACVCVLWRVHGSKVREGKWEKAFVSVTQRTCIASHASKCACPRTTGQSSPASTLTEVLYTCNTHACIVGQTALRTRDGSLWLANSPHTANATNFHTERSTICM